MDWDRNTCVEAGIRNCGRLHHESPRLRQRFQHCWCKIVSAYSIRWCVAGMASKPKGKGRRPRDDSPDVKLSKFLSYICRHGAEKVGLQVHDGGFVTVPDILSLHQGRQYSEEDVRRVVGNCPKQRFALREHAQTGQLQIRANQGHTIQVEDLDLTSVLSAEEAPVVVHGTLRRAWEQIRVQGLSRMKRTHIHFATGLPGESGVISGMRSSCQVLIFVNLKKALEDGFKFYRSTNDVILCPGNENGLLPPKYFSEVRAHPSGALLTV